MPNEKTLERKLRERVKAAGGLAVKFTPMGFVGMPDRIILLPGGRTAFAELKSKGKTPRPVQDARLGMLRRMGFTAAVIDNEESLNDFLETVME